MKQKELYKTAIYCLLSLDDGSIGESGSIQTQKMLLEKYCKDNGYEIYGSGFKVFFEQIDYENEEEDLFPMW